MGRIYHFVNDVLQFAALILQLWSATCLQRGGSYGDRSAVQKQRITLGTGGEDHGRRVGGVNMATRQTRASSTEISPRQPQLHNMSRHFESFIVELFPPQKKVVPVGRVVFDLPGTSCEGRALLFC